jgi:hypothetical protein
MEKYEKIMGHVGIPLDHTGKNIALSMKRTKTQVFKSYPVFLSNYGHLMGKMQINQQILGVPYFGQLAHTSWMLFLE